MKKPLPGHGPPYCVVCEVREGHTDYTDVAMCDECRAKGTPISLHLGTVIYHSGQVVKYDGRPIYAQ